MRFMSFGGGGGGSCKLSGGLGKILVDGKTVHRGKKRRVLQMGQTWDSGEQLGNSIDFLWAGL